MASIYLTRNGAMLYRLARDDVIPDPALSSACRTEDQDGKNRASWGPCRAAPHLFPVAFPTGNTYYAHMIFYQIKAGGDRNFAYLAADNNGGKGVLFDPPPDSSRYLPLVEKHALDVLYCVATHGHSDHTWGLKTAAKTLQAKTVAFHSSTVRPALPVRDGDTLPLGSLHLTILHTPGHTDDSICILVGDKLITGDTLFVGKVGGTDFGEEARKEWESFQTKIVTLDGRIEVYPGHDYGLQPTSTIAREKNTNPFLLRTSFEEFVSLKKNWLQYKKEHGIP